MEEKEFQKNWKIFNNKTFKPFAFPKSCLDTVQSYCPRGLSLEECLKKCDKFNDCDAGYFLKFPDKKSFCFPLKTNSYPFSNPTLFMHDKDEYDSLKDVETNVFVNEKIFPFPEERVNIVWETDMLLIKNVETDTILSTYPAGEGKDTQIRFSTDGDIKFQIFYPKVDITLGPETRVIRNNSHVIFSKTQGNLLLASSFAGSLFPSISPAGSLSTDDNDPEDESYFTYVNGFSLDMPIYYSFNIRCPYKGHDQPILYTDYFYLELFARSSRRDSGFLGLDENNYLTLYSNKSLESLKNTPHKFTFIPEEKVSYCENGVCKKIELNKTKVDPNDNLKATFNGNPTTRSRSCFGLCELIDKENPITNRDNSHVDSERTNHINSIIILSITISIILSLVILLN